MHIPVILASGSTHLSFSLSEDLVEMVRKGLREGERKIRLIVKLREATGVGLLEAKTACDLIENEENEGAMLLALGGPSQAISLSGGFFLVGKALFLWGDNIGTAASEEEARAFIRGYNFARSQGGIN